MYVHVSYLTYILANCICHNITKAQLEPRSQSSIDKATDFASKLTRQDSYVRAYIGSRKSCALAMYFVDSEHN